MGWAGLCERCRRWRGALAFQLHWLRIPHRLIKPIASFIVKRRSATNMRNRVPKARRPRAKPAAEEETSEEEFEAPPEDDEDETDPEE